MRQAATGGRLYSDKFSTPRSSRRGNPRHSTLNHRSSRIPERVAGPAQPYSPVDGPVLSLTPVWCNQSLPRVKRSRVVRESD